MVKDELFNNYFKSSTEELRTELCLDELPRFLTKKSQLLDKFNEIKEMLEKQEEVHKMWLN